MRGQEINGRRKAMKRVRTVSNIIYVAAFAILIVGCAMTQRTEELLSAAGFKSVPANTPAQQARLKALPANKITMVQRHGRDYFVFPDASQNVLYVGQKSQLQKYQALRGEQVRLAQDEMNNPMVSPEWDEWEPWTGPYWQ
jgi:hypothetical protein